MDQIEEVKQKTDIVELINGYVPLKKAGRNYKGLCPFHGEKTPSFMVNPELQIYKCFGCGEGGDALAFLQKMEGIEFGEALKILADKAGVKLTSYLPSKGEQDKQKLLEITHLAAEYYHYLLTKHKLGKEAEAYLNKRGITDEAKEIFKIGFAPDGWDFGIRFLVGKKGYRMEEVERAGLAIKGQRDYDRFRNRIMFPLNNPRGQTVGFAGRILPNTNEQITGSKREEAKYVNTPETEIYHKGELLYGLDINKTAIKTEGAAVIVEGEVDAIASWLGGVKNVVAIKGSALTEPQTDLIRRYCDTIIMALDADSAGDAANRRGIEIAQKKGLVIKVVNSENEIINPKQYKDPGDWAIADPESWRKAVAGAVPIYDFYLESAVKRFGLDAIGKSKISRELIPIWAKIEDEIVKAHYIKRLAEVLTVEEEDVRKQLAKLKIQLPAGQTNSNLQTLITKTEKSGRREVLEEYLMGLVLWEGRLDELKKEEVRSLFKTSYWVKVVEQIAHGAGQIASSKELIDKLPAELREKIEVLLLTEDKLSGEEWNKEWQRTVRDLEVLGIKERMMEIKAMIDQQVYQDEMGGLTKKLTELTREV